MKSPNVRCGLPVAFAVVLASTACDRSPAPAPPAGPDYALVRTEPTTVADHRSGLEFVLVPAGEFTMGGAGRDELPRHPVQLSEPFWLARTEVTIGQWKRYAKASGNGEVPLPEQGDDAPMQVSHADAASFCRFYGYALPTEAQWEWACRAGDDTVPTRIDLDVLRANAWYHHNAGMHPMPVGTLRANAFGLHDMLGNVWEWCADRYGPYAPSVAARIDPTGPTTGTDRVLRGGSWFSLPPALPSTRAHEPPALRTPFFGFRPACPRRTFGI